VATASIAETEATAAIAAIAHVTVIGGRVKAPMKPPP
jgi:hypothetical protein